MNSHKDICRFTIVFVFITLLCTVASAQHLGFNPSISIPATTSFQIDLQLTTNGTTVQGLDIVFSYNPIVVQLNGVNAGGWLTISDYYLWNNPASALGFVHVSAALLGAGSNTDGAVLTLDFEALEAGISPLDFVSIDLRDDANAPIPGATHSFGDHILIEEAIANEVWSVGAVKSHWR